MGDAGAAPKLTVIGGEALSEVSGSSGHGVESSRSRDAYTRGEVLFEGLTLALAMAAWTSFTECSLPGPRLLRMRECVTS